MGEISYKPLIEDMTWSYSRVSSFDNCPYGWFLKYIHGCKDKEKFYVSYGKFIHKLIEWYYKGILNKEEMLTSFLTNFIYEVRGERPQQSTVTKYITDGTEYLEYFEPFPYKPIDVEREIKFNIDGHNMICYIDYIGEDENGDLVIIDHKSGDIHPFSNRKKPTKTDEGLMHRLRQLYIYAEAVKQEFGRLPKWLIFNVFRKKLLIKHEFYLQNFEESKQWLLETIEKIADEEDFRPNINPFTCKWICGVSHECEYWELSRRSR